jgi:hypothetical protein
MTSFEIYKDLKLLKEYGYEEKWKFQCCTFV